MKVIIDVGNKEYYRTRAVEEIQMKGATMLAIQLLVLSIAERENEEIHSKKT